MPWTLGLAAVVGAAVMASPGVLGVGEPLYAGVYFAGVWVVVVSVCAWAEVARALRFLNVPAALWLLVAPFVLDGGGVGITACAVVGGLAIAAISLPQWQGRRAVRGVATVHRLKSPVPTLRLHRRRRQRQRRGRVPSSRTVPRRRGSGSKPRG